MDIFSESWFRKFLDGHIAALHGILSGYEQSRKQSESMREQDRLKAKQQDIAFELQRAIYLNRLTRK